MKPLKDKAIWIIIFTMWALIIMASLLSCTKKPDTSPKIYQVETITEFGYIFYRINSEPDTMINVVEYYNLRLCDNLGDTIMFVASGKVIMEVRVLRGDQVIIEHTVQPFDRDTINFIIY